MVQTQGRCCMQLEPLSGKPGSWQLQLCRDGKVSQCCCKSFFKRLWSRVQNGDASGIMMHSCQMSVFYYMYGHIVKTVFRVNKSQSVYGNRLPPCLLICYAANSLFCDNARHGSCLWLMCAHAVTKLSNLSSKALHTSYLNFFGFSKRTGRLDSR